MIRNKNVNIRLTENEYKEILSKAIKNDMNPTSYIRARIFDDIVLSEESNFEYKILKILSFNAAVSNVAINKYFSDKEQKAVNELFDKIAFKNGIDIDSNE